MQYKRISILFTVQQRSQKSRREPKTKEFLKSRIQAVLKLGT